jgi:D-alanine--poly(phosphoribitol) ligase subunit 1
MQFDFIKNQFVDTDTLSNDPYIIGSDTTLSNLDVYNLHLKLKQQLILLNIPQGHPVCIYGEKEAIFPVIMITLVSLNIPYIPIDAIMPVGRIQKIQEQTQSNVIINCSDKICEVPFDIKLSKNFEIITHKANTNFFVLKNGEDPIRYILFTSGSTGVPKGVQITKRALNSFVDWFLKWPLINSQSVYMNQAPFSFDISLCDFIGAFANGSKLILNNYSILKNGTLFLNRLKDNEANTIVCTPSFIQMYLSVPEFNASVYTHLKQIIFIGEELPVITAKKLKRAFPSLKVINAYGPTEATVVTTYIEITDDILTHYPKSLPIGYNRPDGEILVLNKDSETGVGELGISGPHLSIGYLNDEEKTKNAFINYNGKIIYKTGDVGYIKDSIIFYLGRNDSQVKLNGYRIELEEISNVLLTHPSIINASTVPLTAGGVTKKIICFIIMKNDLSIDHYSEVLKSFLLNHLPSYMIPSEFIIMQEFPLNSNYKTDKKALLEGYLSRN